MLPSQCFTIFSEFVIEKPGILYPIIPYSRIIIGNIVYWKSEMLPEQVITLNKISKPKPKE